MFNDFNLSDEDVIEIIEKYSNLIYKNSLINGKLSEDLKQDIILNIYISLTKKRLE